jgi:uncharacterized membrane protein (UPF0136 family)
VITTILVYASLILTVGGMIPYLIDVMKKKTKPRIVSWGVWSVLTAIAGIASYADGQYPTAWLMAAASLTTLSVVVLGYRNGDHSLEKLDIICLIGAVMGLVLWWYSGSATLAVLVTVLIDFVGVIPTLVHSWQKPHEETWITFAFGGLGGVATMLAVDTWVVTSVAYPIYIVIANTLITSVILARKKYAVSQVPQELRRL